MKVGGGKWSWVEVAARFVVVMVISFRCYWYSGSASYPPPPSHQESRLLEFLQRPGGDGIRGMEGNSSIVIEDVCEDDMQNLGGRLVLILMRAGILVGELVLVTVKVMLVVVVGLIFISEKRCLLVMKVECLGVVLV